MNVDSCVMCIICWQRFEKYLTWYSYLLRRSASVSVILFLVRSVRDLRERGVIFVSALYANMLAIAINQLLKLPSDNNNNNNNVLERLLTETRLLEQA